MRIDGIKSNPITLTNGNYTTEASLIAEIQSQINSDATLKDKGVAVNVAIEDQGLVIKSNTYGSTSTVAMLSVDDSVTGTEISAFDFTTPPVNISATSTFDITVDGALGSIDIQGSYNTEIDLINALQADILAKTGKAATVSITDNKLSITSDSGGTVAVSNLGATSLTELGLADTTDASDLGIAVGSGSTGVGAKGTINGAEALSDGRYLLAQSGSGDAQGLKLEVKGGDFTYLAQNSVLAYPFTATTDSTFELNVDGATSSPIDLTGQTFTTDNDLISTIQALLDADTNLSNAGEAVTVGIVSGKIQFTSANATSQLSVSSTGAGAISDLGLTVDSAIINSTISFSEGITSKIDVYLNAVIDNSISNNDGDVYSSNVDNAAASSLIDAKTDSLYKKLIDIDKQEESLNYKMEQYEKRLFKEFNAMDMLVAQLGSTMSSLQGALDALPGYTREKNN
jgi:flagellar hook-associated protein 2